MPRDIRRQSVRLLHVTCREAKAREAQHPNERRSVVWKTTRLLPKS